ncbi:MAG: T9SS type A sorting domain-containing protein [Bacteroidota bacterium]
MCWHFSLLTTQISVYPNPNIGQFTLVIESNAKQSQIEIYNVLGEKVYSEKILNLKSLIINLDVPDGVYFLQLKSENGTETKKLIIQK